MRYNINYSNKLVEKLNYKLLGKIRHDKDSFTQGLYIDEDYIYEVSGKYGKSRLRKVDLNGNIIKKIDLGDEYFGEGLTIMNDKIYILTYLKQKGLIYEKKTLNKLGEFNIKTDSKEGWGLTNNKNNLIISDGTDKLYYLNPESFEINKTLKVKEEGKEVKKINELEYVKMENDKDIILANIWYSNKIIGINPENGNVEIYYDMSNLLKEEDKYGGENVLNGIAKNNKTGDVYLTGKLYQYYYKTKLEKIK